MSKQTKRNAHLQALCLLEALTLLALVLIAVPLKYIGGYKLGVALVGPMHGLAFLAFCWAAGQALALRDISASTGWRILLAAFIPFGGIFSWARLRRSSASATQSTSGAPQ